MCVLKNSKYVAIDYSVCYNKLLLVIYLAFASHLTLHVHNPISLQFTL